MFIWISPQLLNSEYFTDYSGAITPICQVRRSPSHCLRDISKPKTADELIFTVDNANELSKRTLLYHWHKMIELADVADRDVRDLVPYSLRHFMITQRIMSGLSFKQIADMCGTSVAQIERTYYHLNDEIRLTNALADYRRNEDGTIEAI